MSQSIERPNYYEGQILGANDLSSAVDYSRGKWERHDRYLHSWGIVTGLELELLVIDKSTKRVIVKPGSAIDGHGREIVLSSEFTLEESKFIQFIGEPDDKVLYPVFIQSVYKEQAANTQLTGSCNVNASTRISEDFEITFGRKGEEQNLDEQATIEVGDSPGSIGSSVWKILLGFVKWQKKKEGKNPISAGFSDFSTEADGIQRYYAGVYADNVIARGGKLSLQTSSKVVVGTPMVILDEKDGGQFKFGLYKGGNELNELFSVDDKGNLTVPGRLEGALSTGVTLVESGVASDGMRVPLPAGITQEQVDDNKVTLHISVSPRYDPGMAPISSNNVDIVWVMIPHKCIVDENRKISCSMRWLKTDVNQAPNGLITEIQNHPGVCDYTITASVAAGDN